jgi:hypothetical protein
MRLKFFGLALLACAGLTALAPGAFAQSFDLGLEAGTNFSTLVGKDLSSVGNVNASRMGLVGGGYLALNFGPSFALRPEILYEQKGAAVSGTTTTTELDYIEVPVLLKLGLGTPVFNPNILLGPAFSWNTLAKGPAGTIPNVNSSDVGLVGGIEIDLDKFLVSGRYELGLDNVAQKVNVQNGTFTFLIGYSFI